VKGNRITLAFHCIRFFPDIPLAHVQKDARGKWNWLHVLAGS
jgi:hypothetical protein